MKNTLTNLFKTFFFFDLLVIAQHTFVGYSKGGTARSAFISACFSLVMAIAVTLVFFLFVERRTLPLFSFDHSVRHIGMGILLGCFPLGITAGLLKLFRRLTFGVKLPVSSWAFWLLALLAETLFTELLLRGYLFQLYRKYYGVAVVTGLLSILYLSLHTSVFSGGRLYVLNYLVFNMLLCLLLEYTGSFVLTVAVHFAYKMLGGFVLGAFSALEGCPSLFSVTVSGKTWFTGGSHPLQGSAILLVIHTALCAYFLFHIVKTQKKKLI